MIAEAQQIAEEQTAHLDFAESLKQAVIEQTGNGTRIVRSVVSIMEGDAPNCTPWHQLEAAKLLRKLGLGTDKPPLPHKSVIPAHAGIQSGADVAGEGSPKLPSPLTGEGQDGGEDNQNPSSSSMSVNPEQTKFTNKLIRQIRVHTGDGASIVRYLIEIMEGEDPTTRGRDRLEAIKMLLGICLDSPAFPSAEFMLQAARCHPDCFCVCEDLPEDHPEVAKMHTPLTAEQRQQMVQSSRRSRKSGTGA